MASPPNVPQINVPRKRGSISSITSASKKRKPSQLRNSFAPESEVAVGSPLRYSRSPSVDSVATSSVANGTGGGSKKRRRKDKDGGDNNSVAGSSVRDGKAGSRSAVGGEEGQGGEGGGEGGEDEDDEDEDLGEEMDAVLEGGKITEATKKQEKEHERMLMEAMDANQADRYATYRRIRLKRETVRRLVNQTLSQSVPQPVIIAVTSYAKGFIGELVDRALTVRDEWAVARTHIPNPDIPPALLAAGFNRPSAHIPEAKPIANDLQDAHLHTSQVDMTQKYWLEIGKDAPLDERLRQCNKGPLTQAHMREALRRYKRDRDGGGAGFAGLSLEGPERALGRTGGKRLFR